jgi:hypothetical protein
MQIFRTKTITIVLFFFVFLFFNSVVVVHKAQGVKPYKKIHKVPAACNLTKVSGYNRSCRDNGKAVYVSWNPVQNANEYMCRVNHMPTGMGVYWLKSQATERYFAVQPGVQYRIDIEPLNSTSNQCVNYYNSANDYVFQTRGPWDHFTCTSLSNPIPTGLSAQCNSDGKRVTLSWNKVTGATNYIVRVDAEPYCCAPNTFVAEDDTWVFSEGKTTFTRDITPGKNYRFSIESAWKDNGTWSRGNATDVKYFKCIPTPTAVPGPVINEFSSRHPIVYNEPHTLTMIGTNFHKNATVKVSGPGTSQGKGGLAFRKFINSKKMEVYVFYTPEASETTQTVTITNPDGKKASKTYLVGTLSTPTPNPTAVPPTAVPPTAVPTAVPPTAVPPTAVPPTAVPPTAVPTATPIPPTPTESPNCPKKNLGDANCDNQINDADFARWKCEFLGNGQCENIIYANTADFDNVRGVEINDYEIWRRNKHGS